MTDSTVIAEVTPYPGLRYTARVMQIDADNERRLLGLCGIDPAIYRDCVDPSTFISLAIQEGVRNGISSNGGVNTDPTARVMTIDVTPVNDAPAGTSKTVTMLKNGTYTFTQADFSFSDPKDTLAHTLRAVKITTLPAAGKLTNNGVAVKAGAAISAADIAANRLKFAPAANASGAMYAKFTFKLQDNGGAANGGIDTDPVAKTITIAVG
jgi:hypothetical protein